MSHERLKLKLVAAGYEEDVVVAMERETMLSTYAEFLASGGVRPGAAAQVGYDPDVEAQKLAFEKQRWEAERERINCVEKRLKYVEKRLREKRERLREKINYVEKRLRENINYVKKKLNSVDGKLIEKRDKGRSWLKMRDDRRKCNNRLSYLHRDSVSLIARRPEIEPRRQDVIVPF